MKRISMMCVVLCLMLVGACSGGDADRNEHSDVDDDVSVSDGDSITEIDVTDEDSVAPDTADNESTDVDTAEDTDAEPVIREPEGIAITAGGGTISSERYQMEITVGRPGTGGTMQSENYSIDLLIK